MKKNLGWITMAAVVAASPLTQAKAGEDAVPFQACKNVHVSKTDAEREAWEKAHPGCYATVAQSAPAFGANLATAPEAIKISLLMGDVAKNQYMADLDKRIAYWNDTKKCFDNPSSSATCKKRVDKIENDYGSFVGDLRRNLAQTNVSSKDGKKVPSSDLKAFSLKVPFMPNAFPDAVTGAPLQAPELESATAAANGKKGMSESAAKVAYAKTLSKGIESGLYLVSYLPKPTAPSKSGNPEWTANEWKGTIDHLILDAEKEKSATQKTIDSHVLSFGSFSTKDVVGFVGDKERDLMYYATLTPEMEKYLMKNPQACGTALAAAAWMKNMEHDKTAWNFAAFAVGGVGSGVAKAAEAGTIKLGLIGKGIAKGVALGGGTVGASMVYTDYDKTQYKAEETYRQLAKIGSEKGAEGDVVNAKQYAEAKDAADHFWRNNAVAMAGMGAAFKGAQLGAKAASPYAAKLMAATADVFSKNAAKAKDALKVLFMHSNEPEKLAVELEKSMPAQTRSALADPAVEHSIKLSKTISSDMKEMEQGNMIKPDESAEIREMLEQKEPEVARDLELKGECKGEVCHYKAIEKEGSVLRQAKGKCTKVAAK